MDQPRSPPSGFISVFEPELNPSFRRRSPSRSARNASFCAGQLYIFLDLPWYVRSVYPLIFSFPSPPVAGHDFGSEPLLLRRIASDSFSGSPAHSNCPCGRREPLVSAAVFPWSFSRCFPPPLCPRFKVKGTDLRAFLVFSEHTSFPISGVHPTGSFAESLVCVFASSPSLLVSSRRDTRPDDLYDRAQVSFLLSTT